MKKITLAIAILMILLFPVTVEAKSPRIVSIRPGISFSGTTATCSVVVIGETNSKISALVRLWRGNTCIATWSTEGTTYLVFNKSVSISSGQTYILTIDAVIDNVAHDRVFCTGYS